MAGGSFFRSERDGGGLYSVPALGGEPRLLVPGGLSPRLSPDGRQLGLLDGIVPSACNEKPGVYRTFVVDAAGGTPREIEGFANSRFPVWSPDGSRLLVSASTAAVPEPTTYDWWMVPAAGGVPVSDRRHRFARPFLRAGQPRMRRHSRGPVVAC